MKLKDATRILGSVALFFAPLILILTLADSAFACPGHKNGTVSRTRTANTTVITYRAPATYRRCGDNLYDTRNTKYVAVRRSSNGAKFVAVRKADRHYTTSNTRYIAVRNADVDDAPRYVAVRRAPTNVERGTTYVVARSGYRKGNGVIGYITTRNDIDDDVRYVAVRRQPVTTTRYVAVRNVDLDDDDVRYVAVRRQPAARYVTLRDVDDDDDIVHTKYVAAGNTDKGCMRAIALERSCLDQIETTSAKHVVVSDDDDDEYIAVSNQPKYVWEDDGDEYITVSNRPATYVEYAPAAYHDDETYITTTPAVVNTRTISYIPESDDDDIDRLAYLDGGGATYVADDDIEDACMSTRLVSHIPIDDMEAMHITTDATVTPVRYVVDDNDVEIDTTDATVTPIRYEVDDEDVEIETTAATVTPIRYEVDDDDVEIETTDATVTPIRYQVDDDGEVGPSTVSYVPVEETDVETVSYMPVNNVRYITADDKDADECPMLVSNVNSEPVFIANNSATHIAEDDIDLIAELNSTTRIAGEFGYRDGFEDGQDAALERDAYHPENSGDYQKAANGYEDAFGDKDVYKDGYREAYLRGYRAGFDSVGNSG